MELKDILAVSGQPGLFKYIAQSNSGVIVESLTDNRRTIFPSNARVSSLTEIAIFTASEEVPLAQVFEKIYAHTAGKQAISRNSTPEQMAEFFAAVLPDYDRDRVHMSDIKKVITWFNILVAAGMKEFKLPDEAGEQAAEGDAESKPAAAKTAKETKATSAKEAISKPSAGAKMKPSDSAKGVAKAQRPRPKV